MADETMVIDEERVAEEIVITYDGKEYRLAFDRASAKTAERMYGFNIAELTGTVQVTLVENMFHAAFIKNHRKLSQSFINEIFNRTRDKVDLYQELVKMYLATANSALEDAEDVDEGKAASWKLV